jgi:hypothetical protein
MTQHRSSIIEDRPLTRQERALLQWLLEHGQPSAAAHVREIDGLRVVARCGCGCASIDFVDFSAALEILADYKWQDEAGHLFGAFAFAKEGHLAGLEVWSVDGEATPTTLPDPSVLEPLE